MRFYLDSRGEVKASDPFFLSSQAQRMPERTIQAVISQLARRAKITRLAVSAHTLRRTFALNYLRQNPGKLVELASLLGHESLDTTAIYTRPPRMKWEKATCSEEGRHQDGCGVSSRSPQNRIHTEVFTILDIPV